MTWEGWAILAQAIGTIAGMAYGFGKIVEKMNTLKAQQEQTIKTYVELNNAVVELGENDADQKTQIALLEQLIQQHRERMDSQTRHNEHLEKSIDGVGEKLHETNINLTSLRATIESAVKEYGSTFLKRRK